MSECNTTFSAFNSITECLLCYFSPDDEQRKSASTDPDSPRYNALVHAEKIFSHWPFRPSENCASDVIRTLQSLTDSLPDSEEKTKIKNLSLDQVLRHFNLHRTPSYKEICDEQLFMFKCLQAAFVRNMWNEQGEFEWNSEACGQNIIRLKCLKVVCDEVRRIAKESASAT
jgi:hypothetical protein